MTDRSRLTVSLPVADWQALNAEAHAAGLKIGTHATRLLRDHIAAMRDKADTLPPSPDAVPTPEEWDALNKWLSMDPARASRYQNSGYPRKKSGLLAWARTEGFQS